MYPRGGQVFQISSKSKKKCWTYTPSRDLHPLDSGFEHQNHLRFTLDVLQVDFSEKLKFAQSSSKCVQDVSKYPNYVNYYKEAIIISWGPTGRFLWKTLIVLLTLKIHSRITKINLLTQEWWWFQDIFNLNGSIWIFLKNWLVEPQDVMVSIL